MKILFKLLGLLWISQSVSAGVIYGIEQIQDRYQSMRYPAYVQMGSFSTKIAAKQLQHQIGVKTKMPVVIQSSRGRYKVMVGPFQNQSSLKKFAAKTQAFKRRPSLSPRLKNSLWQQPFSGRRSISTLKPKSTHLNRSLILPRDDSHPELSVFLGGTYIPNTINGQTLQLLPYEIGEYADTFTNQSSANAFTWGLDAQYRFKIHAPSTQNYFLDSVGAGIDLFQITNFNQTGKVLQFNLPEFENYTYTLNLNNLRIMADFDLDFHPIQQYFTPFIEGGIGGARTAISYNSAPILPVVSPNFILPNESSWHFAYQAGAGIKYEATTYLVLSLRYLYANMGKANSSILGSSAVLATPLTVNMSTQNYLLGLTYLVA